MKYATRFLALICLLCVLLSSLSSCWALLLLPSPAVTQTSVSEDYTTVSPTQPARSDLTYDLTDADKTRFLDLLGQVETLILTDRSEDADAISAAVEAMEAQYDHIATQNELAYIYYCMNVASGERSEAYLFSSAMLSDLYAEYQAVCRRIDRSDAPYRDAFFADWSEEDLAEMRGYSEEQNALGKANDGILVRYRSLSSDEWYEGTPALYLETVGNNARIAELNGYESYLAYAYEKVYDRDYTPAEARTIHAMVKEYLIPICERVYLDFQSSYRTLNRSERKVINALIRGEYTDVKAEIDGYLAAYPQEAAEAMASLFAEGNLFYTDSENADESAFTAYLYEPGRPVCYFGPNYHAGYTVIHEMGHYYAALCMNGDDVQMDLAETQSQGNEWIFTHYLAKTHSETFGKAVFSYQLYSSLASIVLASIVDEFEQSVYTDLPVSADEFDERMKAICDGYGGRAWLVTLFADPLDYWRGVVIESPCYYISYACSMLTSIGLYEMAKTDAESARTTYLTIVGADMGDLTYPAWIKQLGLESPFEESLYQTVAAMVG